MRNERLTWLVVSALGAWIVWYATANGVGVSMDSMTYLRGAENLAERRGYSMVAEVEGFEPVTHWPPLYSLTLSAPIAAGLSATTAVRVVNVACLFALLYLTARLVRRLSPRPRVPIIASLCVLVSPDIVQSYFMAWSETLFLPLVALALLKMLDDTERGRRRDLMAAAACFGLAAVCRYSGVAFIAGAAAWLLFLDRTHPAPRRVARTLAFGVVAAIPTVALFVRNYFTTASAHDRPLGFHFFTAEHARTALESATRWLLPAWIPLRFRALWLLAVTALVAWSVFRNREALHRVVDRWSAHGRFWTLTTTCVAVYLAFVAVTILFFDFDVQFDPRMMSPVLLVVIVGLVVLGSEACARPTAATANLALAALALSFAGLAADAASRTRAAHREAAQFAGRKWTEARAWGVLRDASSTPVYATSTYVGRYFTNRPVRPLPVPASGEAYLLAFPGLDAGTPESLRARDTVDSTDVVVLYRYSN